MVERVDGTRTPEEAVDVERGGEADAGVCGEAAEGRCGGGDASENRAGVCEGHDEQGGGEGGGSE